MTDHDLSEFTEQRLTKALMRISAELRRGDLAGQCLVDLFDVLVEHGRQLDGESQGWTGLLQKFSEPAVGSLQNHRLLILLAMLHDTQTRLQSRASLLAERLEAQAVARQAQVRYGGVASWDNASPTLSAILCQS